MGKFFRNLVENFREYITLAALLIISLFLLSLNDKPGIQKFRSYAFGTFAYVSSAVDSFTGLFQPTDELVKLQKENARLMLEVNKIRNYALENEELRNLLSLKDTSNYPLIAADIISKLTSNIDGNFIINIGESDSVNVGMPVINHEGLVGIIISRSDEFSIVRTLENTKLNLAVSNQRSKINGILSWNGQRLVIKFIPTTFDMKIGDRIETSDFSTILPPSIPIGIIEEKETEVSGLLSNIFVKPFADVNTIENIFVMQVEKNEQIDSLELNLLRRLR